MKSWLLVTWSDIKFHPCSWVIGSDRWWSCMERLSLIHSNPGQQDDVSEGLKDLLCWRSCMPWIWFMSVAATATVLIAATTAVGDAAVYNMYNFNYSPPSAAYKCQCMESSLVQVMAWRLFGAKPLPEPVLVYYQLDTLEQVSMKFEL